MELPLKRVALRVLGMLDVKVPLRHEPIGPHVVSRRIHFELEELSKENFCTVILVILP